MAIIQVPPDSTGKRVDTVTLTDATVEVHRQKMVVTGGSGTAEVVVVTNAAPAAGDMGLVVRQAGTASVALAAGTANIGSVNNISATVTVAGNVNISATPSVVLAAGTANIGTLNNVSATVAVAGVVGLTAGTAVIGDINAISRTVQVAVGTPFTVNNISATTIVAGVVGLTAGTANIGSINNISATVTVSGNVNLSNTPSVVLATGTANFGTLNNISASVQVATGAVADFAITATVTQNLPLIGIAQSADTGAVAWGGSVTVANNINISNTASVVLAAGTANFGTLNDISRTVQVAIGTPFTLQGISTTVTVAGVVGLTAGTAVIGDLNAISRTVQVAVGTPFTVNNISATVTVAGVVNISATASVILAAGTANFGTLNNISATVNTSSVIRTSGGTAVEDTANNALRVNVVAGSAGGPSKADGETFTLSTGAANLSPIGCLLDDVSPGSASEGAAGILRMTPLRAMHTNLRLATGTAVDDAANTAIRVNVVAGGGAGGGTSMADRGTFTPGTTSHTPAGGTYNTTAASLSDGEAAAVRITLNRGFHVNLRDNSGGEITASNPLSVKVERTSATDSVVLAAGTANIGIINNVSATVTVAGNVNISATPSVILAAGTANFGTLNNISATVTVAGNVNISATPSVILAAGTANFGTLNNISATVAVAGVVGLTAGTANIGFINNISASVTIATGASFDFNTLASADQVQNVAIIGIALPASGGASVGGTNSNPLWVNINTVSQTASVVLAAGTANIGTLNNISTTVQVAVGTPFTINNISATTIVAGVISLGAGTNNIGFINNISATVTVAGNVNISATPSVILAAGTANFGTLNDISRTVQVAVGTPFTIQGISTTVTTVVVGYTPAVMAASHGPKCVTASTSANVTLIASPGAGFNIYVTQLMAGNFSGTLTRARIGTSASISTIVQPLAASGGGFVLHFDPPWMLSASEACLCSVKPNVADAFFTVNFFVR